MFSRTSAIVIPLKRRLLMNVKRIFFRRIHFLRVKDEFGIVYSDNAPELIATMKKLGILHNTSRQYVDKN